MQKKAILVFLSFGLLFCALLYAAEKKVLFHTKLGVVEVFPINNPWNQKIDKWKVDTNSQNYLQSIGLDKGLHSDFGTEWGGAPNGIPFVVVGPKEKKVIVAFEYADESDKGPYPLPDDAPIEGGPDGKGDRHIIMLDPKGKKLYELFHAFKTSKGWKAGSGAIFDLSSNELRPLGWTSADAAGLPIFPGLVKYQEVVTQKEIRHALRFTVAKTQKAYILPATHHASKHKDKNLPPMGMRVRLKGGFDLSGYPPQAKVILQALKTYGMFLADNGSDLYVSGTPDEKWDNDDLRWLKKVKAQDLEVVFSGELKY